MERCCVATESAYVEKCKIEAIRNKWKWIVNLKTAEAWKTNDGVEKINYRSGGIIDNTGIRERRERERGKRGGELKCLTV